MTVVAIIHCAALKARDQHVRDLCTSFSACGTSVAVVMGPEPPTHDPTLLATMVNLDPNRLVGACMAFRPLMRDLRVRQLSNSLKHAAAIQHIASQEQDVETWNVVLEDDAIVEDVPRLLAACATAPADADMLFFGLPTPLPHPSREDGPRYDPLLGIKLLPACESYALRSRTACFLSTAVLPIRFSTEVHLSWLIASTSITTYLTSPNLSVDGSKVGLFVSSIESNNRLRFNTEYMALVDQRWDAPGVDVDDFAARIQAMPFGRHPDCQVLLGRRLAAAGRHTEAASVFAAALATYQLEGGVVGQDSEFLRSYMDLFKHSQDLGV